MLLIGLGAIQMIGLRAIQEIRQTDYNLIWKLYRCTQGLTGEGNVQGMDSLVATTNSPLIGPRINLLFVSRAKLSSTHLNGQIRWGLTSGRMREGGKGSERKLMESNPRERNLCGGSNDGWTRGRRAWSLRPMAQSQESDAAPASTHQGASAQA